MKSFTTCLVLGALLRASSLFAATDAASAAPAAATPAAIAAEPRSLDAEIRALVLAPVSAQEPALAAPVTELRVPTFLQNESDATPAVTAKALHAHASTAATKSDHSG